SRLWAPRVGANEKRSSRERGRWRRPEHTEGRRDELKTTVKKTPGLQLSHTTSTQAEASAVLVYSYGESSVESPHLPFLFLHQTGPISTGLETIGDSSFALFFPAPSEVAKIFPPWAIPRSDSGGSGWMSVPAFGEWDMKNGVPDYSMDFTKIREMRKQNKNPSRVSLGNDDELLTSNRLRSDGGNKEEEQGTRRRLPQPDQRRPIHHHHGGTPTVPF
ncbi:hypothetical protein B296_00006743, partial [Ensete ventricosum]